MNIYISGIGGVGLGPLAELAQDAGHRVQGSDPQESPTTERLTKRGIAINQKQNGAFLQACHGDQPIDWFVYSSALPQDHPEIVVAHMLGIKTSKRDEFLAMLLSETKLKLVAVAGTHGKTTTTAMITWAFMQLGIPVSYSIGSTISFGPAGKYDPASEYFLYECDEYDRNFLKFHPHLALITSLDYDHSDTYGTPKEYLSAFRQFADQSDGTILWRRDGALLDAKNSWELADNEVIDFKIAGEHNRRNATLVAKALERLGIAGDHQAAIESFPGADRRFERIAYNLYSDYGHHPTEIAATLQMARELSDHVVLVYQPHQNLRQHELRTQYTDCFELAETIYWLPTYLSREDPSLPVLTADELTENITNIDSVYAADMDDELWEVVQIARDENKLVLFMGAGSIDEWLRSQAASLHVAQVLLVDQQGNFIMQQRDDKPGIAHPGMVSAFGGAVEADDQSIKKAAMRELREETNLQFDEADLVFFRMYQEAIDGHDEHKYTVYYILTGVTTQGLEIHEGQGFVVVGPNNLRDFPLTIRARTVITEYTHPPLLA